VTVRSRLAVAEQDGVAEVHQRQVTDHFTSQALYWKELYSADATLFGLIHRTRRDLALSWIDSLGLPAGARVLDVGCGAGLFALDLARRGFEVVAVDHSPAMAELARREAFAAGVGRHVEVGIADAHALPFATASFDLVVALGVIPFMHSPETALSELARIVRPEGAVLFSSDNRYRLNHLLDPQYSPALAPFKAGARAVATRFGYRGRGIPGHKSSVSRLRANMERAGLQPLRLAGIGYGPFSLFGRAILPERVGIALHLRLQSLADRGRLGLGAVGAQHLVLARQAAAAGL
jgi:ubiquinone/menaquinone biosynthesis C-methylase UbiE